MKKSITISAPGKLMLLGEHAVVYNHPCLVTAVDQRMRVNVELLERQEFWLEAPDVKVSGYKKPMNELGKGEIPKGAKFVEIAVKNFIDYSCHPEFISGSSQKENNMLKQVQHDKIGLKITTQSEFSSQFGFGSSSAATVCVIKALSELFGLQFSQKEIFDLSYKTVLDIQGKGSGFDVAAAVYGGTLYFVTGGKTIEPLNISSLPLIVGYSGLKADTVTLMNKVKEAFADKQDRLNQIYNGIEQLVNQAKKNLLKKDYSSFGKLMNNNQNYLLELGVSINKLDKMIEAACGAGAYGAKLSGAGGGDCMIAIAPEEKRKAVEKGITEKGGKVIGVQANAEGVRIE